MSQFWFFFCNRFPRAFRFVSISKRGRTVKKGMEKQFALQSNSDTASEARLNVACCVCVCIVAALRSSIAVTVWAGGRKDSKWRCLAMVDHRRPEYVERDCVCVCVMGLNWYRVHHGGCVNWEVCRSQHTRDSIKYDLMTRS